MIVKSVSRLIQELGVQSFTVVGGPGAEGFGAGAMQVLASALSGAEGDFAVVLGDVSPRADAEFCRYAANFIDRVALKPVHVVPGNRDGGDFEEYFGRRDKAILAEDFALIMLDDSERRFSDETLRFLRDTLAIVTAPNIVVAFHYPPPNRIGGDSLPVQEWSRFEDAAGVWRKKISVLVCGFGGGYFEDEMDGLRLIVTGGGGTRPRELDRAVRQRPHAVEFSVERDGGLSVRRRSLVPGLVTATGENRNAAVRGSLERAYDMECRAHAENLMGAVDAERRGLANLAALFRAAADSRLRHAWNLRRMLEGAGDLGRAATESLAAAGRVVSEAADRLREGIDTAPDPLAFHVLRQVSAAEAGQAALMERAPAEAAAGRDIRPARYFVCSSCGFPQADDAVPADCPSCGAPGEMLRETR